MKNIHLLPTKEPSRLKKINDTVYLHEDDLFIFDGFRYNHNLYITNDEEIKDGDWFTDDNNSLKRSYKLSHVQFSTPKKIILTTDTKLIENGIQEIVLYYLKWFVKNPSCEFVETKLVNINNIYEILLPKKEVLGEYDKICNPEINKQVEAEIKKLEEKATLEEDTLSKIKFVLSMGNEAQAIRLLEQYGELQAKQMFSKEDLEKAHFDGKVGRKQFKEWFKQYRK